MPRRPLSDPSVLVTCSRCGTVAPANEGFYLTRAGALAQSWCRACEVARVVAWDQEKRRRRLIGPPKPPELQERRTTTVEVNGQLVRRCSRCEETKPVAAFGRGGHRAKYLSSHCKACRTAFERQQRLAGKRVIPAEVATARARRWREANREKARMAVRRRRARLRHAGPMITLTEWAEIQGAWGHRCAYCNVDALGELTMDHVIPVSRGGDSSVENISPACGPKHANCNARKSARTGMEFVHASDGSGPLVGAL